MDKKIPIYFDAIIIDSPVQEISINNSEIGNGSRLKVAAFTKYKNRNGSYITDEYAMHLIESATRGDTPVVGFFDPETQEWASHTGPTLANGYGYVERFEGWEPYTDSDGITRDYAIFSVVLFSKYYQEAKKITGQNQSMELDPATIEGDWANFDGEEYYVYTKGDMLGLCIIGSHKPCFSVSHFFSKNDDTYKSQYEKFSSLLFNLKAQVEEAENNQKGGEQQMEEENKVVEESVHEVEEVKTEEEASEKFENASTEVETKVEEEKTEEESVEESAEEPSEFEALQVKFAELEKNYTELKEKFESRISELEEEKSSITEELESFKVKNNELQQIVDSYTAEKASHEEEQKKELIKKYEKYLDEEEISPIKDMVKDFSYDELNSKLAITYADKQLAGNDEEMKKVSLPEPEESQFALLIKKYRK